MSKCATLIYISTIISVTIEPGFTTIDSHETTSIKSPFDNKIWATKWWWTRELWSVAIWDLNFFMIMKIIFYYDLVSKKFVNNPNWCCFTFLFHSLSLSHKWYWNDIEFLSLLLILQKCIMKIIYKWWKTISDHH